MEVFEVGMMQSKHGGPWLVVSPDARIVRSVHSPHGIMIMNEDGEQILFVKMKITVSLIPLVEQEICQKSMIL